MAKKKRLVQAYKQTPKRKQIQRLGLYVLPVITLGTVFALYLVFSAEAASAGLEIRSYIDKKEELTRIIANERTQLAWLTSYSNMSKRADKLDYEQISEDAVHYMVLPSYPGRTTELSAPLPEGNNYDDILLNAAYQESLMDLIQGLFSPTEDNGGGV